MTTFKPKPFGRYTLQEHIAVGGMAEIFRAKLDGIGGFEKTLAIKRLHANYSSDQQFVKMLVDEAKISALLQHANIVQIFDFGRVSGQYYIAMEYVDGRDLFQILRSLHQEELQMPVTTACFIVSEISQALHYAHCRKHPETGEPLLVIHRDISPQNILLSWSGEVKIADFGIVKAAQRATKTEAGVIKGKFYYMSPEQARGEEIDHRSDVFSAGIVLYEALTSTPLYEDDNESLLLERIQKGDVKSPRELRQDIPEELAQICMKALTPDRSLRYQTALELSRDLSEFLQSREHSFTKTDLSEFLKSLYAVDASKPALAEPLHAGNEDETLVDSEVPAEVIQSAHQNAQLSKDEDVQGATRHMRALTPVPAKPAADMNRTSIDKIPVPEHREFVAPPGKETAAAAGSPIADNTSRPVAKRPTATGIKPLVQSATKPPNVTSPREPAQEQQNTLRSIAATDMIEAERINQLNKQSKQPGVNTKPVPLDFDAKVEAALDQPTPQRQPRRTKADQVGRHLAIAIGLVLLCCLVVLASIFWILTHPRELPPISNARPAKSHLKVVSSGVGSAPTKVQAQQNERADKGSAQLVGKAKIRIKQKAPEQVYKIYLNGELAVMNNDELEVDAGQHTIYARMLPANKTTPEQTLNVSAGERRVLEL